MSTTYRHGTYGEFAASIGDVGTQSGTVAVYVDAAPVNLIRGSVYDNVNAPVKLGTFSAAKRYMGYSENWAKFGLCEAIGVHLDNSSGNVGPIVVINVLDPALHRKEAETVADLTFVNGRATLESDTIILDTLVLLDKVEGTDYSVDYDFAKGQVIIDSIGANKITGTVSAVFFEVDPSMITYEDIIGGVTANGEYTGLGCVDLIYQELGLIPNLILSPNWSHIPAVYEAIIKAGTKVNGHWDSFVYADLPLADGDAKVDTIEAAIKWKNDNGYGYERSKVFWPQNMDTAGRIYHESVLAAWRSVQIDSDNYGMPMETCSNKSVPICKHYFGEGSKNRGFDQERANELNAEGITTTCFWGGQWVLWGPHTAAYKFGQITDNRVIFDNSIRMMMFVTNDFQQDWAMDIDRPMTRAMADTIKNREQEKADARAALGAFIGKPVVHFDEAENSTAELVEGNFVWGFEGTPTPPWKSGMLRVAYTTAGFDSYFGEVE